MPETNTPNLLALAIAGLALRQRERRVVNAAWRLGGNDTRAKRLKVTMDEPEQSYLSNSASL
jgi:hypothetical protein